MATLLYANIVIGQGNQNRIELWTWNNQLVQTVYLNGYRTFSTSIVLTPRGGGVPLTIRLDQGAN